MQTSTAPTKVQEVPPLHPALIIWEALDLSGFRSSVTVLPEWGRHPQYQVILHDAVIYRLADDIDDYVTPYFLDLIVDSFCEEVRIVDHYWNGPDAHLLIEVELQQPGVAA